MPDVLTLWQAANTSGLVVVIVLMWWRVGRLETEMRQVVASLHQLSEGFVKLETLVGIWTEGYAAGRRRREEAP